MNTIGLILIVAGLTIGRPLPEGKYGNQSMVTNVAAGTSVHLAVQAEKKMMIISMDEKASKMTTFKDDKGTDLLAKGTKFSKPAWLGTWVRISDDKKTLTFSVHSDKLPAKEATSLKVKGEAVVNCATGTKTVATKEIPIKVKQIVKCGPVEASISKIGEGWNKKMQLTLKSDKPFDAIKEVSLVMPDGTKLKGGSAGSSSGGWGKNYTYTVSYSFEVDSFPEKAKLSFLVFDGLKTVSVPVDVTVSVGL